MLKLSPALVCVRAFAGLSGLGTCRFESEWRCVIVRCEGGSDGGTLWQEMFLDLESGGNTR